MNSSIRTYFTPMLIIVAIVLAIFRIASAGEEKIENPKPTKAVATLNPTQGNTVQGTVTFSVVDKGLHVVADIRGLTPGKHGFHVHEKGDCSSADATSAGGHFNPENMRHGSPDAENHHVGDLGNMEADSSGHATLDVVNHDMTLSGPHSIVGRGLIVHAQPDDLTSQPVGNAGARVACGVIEISK